MPCDFTDFDNYDSDKPRHYLTHYRSYFEPLKNEPVRLLELGVRTGGSVRFWRDYFTEGRIVGLDVNPPVTGAFGERLVCYLVDQADKDALTSIAEREGPFDIVIDDCAHIAAAARASFECLFDTHLKPGGVYAIEDWGTGYWAGWPDGQDYTGRNHTAGMVGFIKELVDLAGRPDITHPEWGRGAFDAGPVAKIEISHGLAIVLKRG